MLGALLVVVTGVRIRRVYDPPEPDDGFRVLIDRVWPRGVSKERAQVEWRRDLAPSTELRRWFGHDPARFDEFRRRYRAELVEQAADALDELVRRAGDGVVTLVYGARDTEHNNAVVLRELLEERLGSGS